MLKIVDNERNQSKLNSHIGKYFKRKGSTIEYLMKIKLYGN